MSDNDYGEPWEGIDPASAVLYMPGDDEQATLSCYLSARNAARACACVNALAGRDPGRLEDLEDVVDEAICCIEDEPSEVRDLLPALRSALAAFRMEAP